MVDDPLNRLKVKRGSQLPQAKLNEEQVRKILRMVEIRQHMDLRRKQFTNAAIAKRLGLHQRTIDKIVAGESWGHVQ